MSQRLSTRRFLYCLLQGESFSPSLAEARTGLCWANQNEPGALATSGRYQGKPLPYGSAMLVLLDDDLQPDASPLEPLRTLKEKLPELRAAGATEATLYLVVAYETQCDFEFTPEELGALASVGLTLGVSCYRDV
jgi:hypothetical protein